jgi:hypothetical protein
VFLSFGFFETKLQRILVAALCSGASYHGYWMRWSNRVEQASMSSFIGFDSKWLADLIQNG